MYFFLGEICETSSILKVIYFIEQLLHILFIIVPIGLILIISVDFLKNVISQNDEFKKNAQMAFKRILMAVAMFLVPTIVQFTMILLGDLGVDFATCFTNANLEQIASFEAQEQEEQSNSSSDNSNATTGNLGDTVSGISATDSKNSNFKLKKTSVTIGHYDKKINTYSIEILSESGKKLDSSNFNFESSNSGVASVSSNGVVSANFGGKAVITITSKSDSSKKAKLNVFIVNSLYVKVTVKKKVTGTSLLTGRKVTLSAGTKGIYNGLGTVGMSSASAKKVNGSLVGNVLYVNKDYVAISYQYVSPYQYHIVSVYDKNVVEDFVNTSGFSSKTKYLFWSNQGTQTEYMFTGSKGKWKLYKTFIINTGDSSHVLYPKSAITGVHFDYVVGEHASYSGYPMGVIWKRKPDGGRTNPWHQYGTGKRYPASHGCTRFSTTDLKYLINNNSKFKGSTLIDY